MAIQCTTRGTYREIWQDATPLNGGSSIVVPTGISANSASLPRVFGILSLRTIVGAPDITATPSILNGRLVVTITNAAAPGNSAAWKLDVTVNHSIQQSRDPNGQGAIYVIGTPLVPTAINWQARFFFLDGDNGDDSHVGYIDAPPGTEFTPAQAAAVAIKTTSRLEQVRPMDGEGRLAITLIKPRAGGIPYDHVVEGDAAGREDRRRLVNYSLLHTRGSDLTNSAADKLQLGYVTVDGPYTVQSTANTANGRAITCTTPIATQVFDLPLLRIHISTAGGELYGPVRWGDTATAPLTNPEIVTTWPGLPGAPINPGDTIYFENPGVSIVFFEAPSFQANTYSSVTPLLAAGLFTHSGSQFGCDFTTESLMAWYAGIRDNSSMNVSGSISSHFFYIDEVGTVRFSGIGIVAAGGLYCGTNGITKLEIFHSYIGANSTLEALHITLYQTSILDATLYNGSRQMSLTSVDYGQIQARTIGRCEFASCRYIPNWGAGIILSPDQGATVIGSVGPSFTIYDLASLYPPDPTTPTVQLLAGLYTVVFDFSSSMVGGGAKMYHNVEQTLETILAWDDLKITGFEVENGIRVVCRYTDQDYPNNMLPCPRGILMRMVDGVLGTYHPVGLVVTAPGAAAQDRFDLAISDNVANMRIVGALLTSVVQGDGGIPGGYAIVGYDGIMVLRREDGSAGPDSGDPLYLSASAAGYITRVAPAAPSVKLGRALPVGPNTSSTGDAVATAWEPEEPVLS
jgi:hypothetical protein